MAPLVRLFDPASLPPEQAERLLIAEERQRAARFHFEADRVRWAACRAELRLTLADELGLAPLTIRLNAGPYGKPELAPGQPPLAFNLSHCHDLALIVTGKTGPLGIDIEPLSRASLLEGCEETFCHPEEIAALPEEERARHAAMLEIWTAKEAFLKALGTGLSYPPQAVRVDLERGRASSPDLPDLDELVLYRLRHPALAAHLAALACPADLPAPGWEIFTPRSSAGPPGD